MIEVGLNNDSKTILYIKNNMTNFSERIIKDDINTNNLFYMLSINIHGDVNIAIKEKYIPSIKQTKTRMIKYEFLQTIGINIEDLDESIIYSFCVELIEKNSEFENMQYKGLLLLNQPRVFVKSNVFTYNAKYGEISEDRIKTLYSKIYGKKMFSLSEKDAIKKIKNTVNLNDLNNFIENKEIKKFTYDNRNFKDIDKFKNSNYKFSKKMTEERKKKIIYTANAIVHFEELQAAYYNKQDGKFLENEWHMGPIYSYDYNYKNLKD